MADCACCDASHMGEDNNTTTKYEPFQICLGLGRTLIYDGYGLTLQGTTTVADGWYSKFYLSNGCITTVDTATLPVYKVPSCASDCGCGSSTGSTGVVSVSPNPANLTTLSGGDILTTLTIGQCGGITVGGAGTASNPLTFSVPPSSASVYFKSGTPSAITVTGSGSINDMYTVSMTSVMAEGTYGGFSVDSYGRITGYTAPSPGVASAVDGYGTTANTVGGVLRIDLAQEFDATAQMFGGYQVSIDASGRVVTTMQSIQLEPADTFLPMRNYAVKFNELGSATEVTEVRVLANTSSEYFYSIANTGDDVVRSIVVTTDLPGYIEVDYTGGAPGFTVYTTPFTTVPNNYGISVDGVRSTNQLLKTHVSGMSQDTTTKLVTTQYACNGLIGKSNTVLQPGTHTIQIRLPSGAYKEMGHVVVRVVDAPL